MFVVLVSAGIAVAVWMGLESMRPSARAQVQAEMELPLSSLQEGVPEFINVFGRTLIVLRPSPAQREAIARMDAHVWDSTRQAWHEATGIFVFWGYDTRLGCPLRHVPTGQSARVLYSEDAAAEWLEGYVSICGEAAYDLAGRAIKDVAFSYNGAIYDVPNLDAPPIRRSGSHFMMSIKPY